MIVPDSASFGSQQVGRLGSYIVRGPQGEFYGKYATYPEPSQIPPYAIVEKAGGEPALLGEHKDEGLF